MSLQNRYDFVFLFDVKDGNPNGDPDAGNMPRMDAETGRGLVTDVSLKRKIRNYIRLVNDYKSPFDIYVKEKAVLGHAHKNAFSTLGISLGEETSTVIPPEFVERLDDMDIPDGLRMDENEDGKPLLVVEADADVKAIKNELKVLQLDKALKSFFDGCLKGVKARKPTADEVDSGRVQMCKDYYDVRSFGAVMSLKSAPNCGQVRGPVQMTFARSVDRIVPSEHSITRMAVATDAESEKQSGDNRTMGRKFTVPYGLYVAHGFISAHLADQTGFSDGDLELLWQALGNMFEHDRSASRGEMATRGLYVFKHEGKLGNAPAYSLFERVKAELKDKDSVPRSFSDYTVTVDADNLPNGVELLRLIG